MNTQIFYLMKYDLKGIEGHKSLSNFSVNPTLPLMDGPLMLPPNLCVFLSFLVLYSPLFLLHSLYIPLFPLFCSLQTLIYILKGHMRQLLCHVIFNDFQIFWSNYNLDLFYLNLHSYGQLFVLVLHVSHLPLQNEKKNLFELFTHYL